MPASPINMQMSFLGKLISLSLLLAGSKIFDIVETGKTLLENDLIPFETIVPISARLIANKASFGFKAQKIREIKNGLLSKVKTDD